MEFEQKILQFDEFVNAVKNGTLDQDIEPEEDAFIDNEEETDLGFDDNIDVEGGEEILDPEEEGLEPEEDSSEEDTPEPIEDAESGEPSDEELGFEEEDETTAPEESEEEGVIQDLDAE